MLEPGKEELDTKMFQLGTRLDQEGRKALQLKTQLWSLIPERVALLIKFLSVQLRH